MVARMEALVGSARGAAPERKPVVVGEGLMTHAEVKAWFDENLERKMREMGVPHWRITIVYGRLGDDADSLTMMQCSSWPDYERARISVDSARYEEHTADTLESDFEHELGHVVHSPFEIFREMALNSLPSEQHGAIEALFCRCAEMTVRNMERMIFGLRESAYQKGLSGGSADKAAA